LNFCSDVMTDSDKLTPGAILKTRRLELGISIADIASKTMIRRAYLEDLEADRFDAFPGEVYLKGFMRTYAETLGLEAETVLSRRQELFPPTRSETGEILSSGTQPDHESTHPRQGKARLYAAIGTGATMLAVALLLFNYFGIG
jgi:cytoskeletal protein RodZ